MGFREHWTHEDNLVNHRLSWLSLSQAFLIGAFAVSLNQPPGAAADRASLSEVLVASLPWVGLLSVAVGFLGLLGSLLVQRAIERTAGDAPSDPARIWSPWSRLGWIPPIGLPLLYSLIWILILQA